MANQEHKYASSSMSIVGQGIILLRVRFVAILGEMETIYVGNAMLEAHVKSKEVMMDFMVFLRYGVIFFQFYISMY